MISKRPTADRRLGRMILRSLIFSALALTFVTPVAEAQRDRKQIYAKLRKLEQKIDKLKSSIDKIDAGIEKKKAPFAKKFEAASDTAALEKVGEQIFAAIEANKAANGKQLDSVISEIQRPLRKALGPVILDVIREDLRTSISGIIEEGRASPIRAARAVQQAIRETLGKDSVDEAWKRALTSDDLGGSLGRSVKKHRRQTAERKELEQTIESLRRSLTSDVKGNVPNKMVVVPGGTLIAGVDRNEIKKLAKADRESEEKNLFLFNASNKKKVKVATFLIDQYEVTHNAYWYFCTQTKRERLPIDKNKKPLWSDGKVPEGWGKRPITHVSLDDAIAYARWTGCRLPTEFEWELAARSGASGFDGRYWAFGNDYERYAINDAQSDDMRERRNMITIMPDKTDLAPVMPVGFFEKGKSPLGIYDMNGNVAEFTISPYVPYESFKSFTLDKEGKHRVNSVAQRFDEETVVVRGGHCALDKLVVSSFMRAGVSPLIRTKYLGFRRVRSAVAGKDLLDFLVAGNKLDARLIDFKKLRQDEKLKRDFPVLDLRPNRFAALQKLDWNDELGVPGQAHNFLVVSRNMKEIDTEVELATVSTGENPAKDSCLLGMIRVDAEIEKPALTPGHVLRRLQGRAQVPRPGDEEASQRTGGHRVRQREGGLRSHHSRRLQTDCRHRLQGRHPHERAGDLGDRERPDQRHHELRHLESKQIPQRRVRPRREEGIARGLAVGRTADIARHGMAT